METIRRMTWLSRHALLAWKQLKLSAVIGIRQTPVVSFWPMRDKWKNRGWGWETLGTDGDLDVSKRGTLAIPTTLVLAYFRVPFCRDCVCQLAYILQAAPSPQQFEAARFTQYKAV